MAGNKCANSAQHGAVRSKGKPTLCKMLIVEPLDEFCEEIGGLADGWGGNAQVEILAWVRHLHEELHIDLLRIELSGIKFGNGF
jgi:hypothetical protein